MLDTVIETQTKVRLLIKMIMGKTLQQLEYIYYIVIRCFKPFLVK